MKRTVMGALLIFGVWALFHYSGLVNTLYLPSPIESSKKMLELLLSGNLNNDLKSTSYRWFAGYAGGILAGVPIGLIMGSSNTLRRILDFPVDFFRSLPVTALFPLFLLVLGIGDKSKIAMVWTAVLFVVIINSSYGVLQAPKKRILMARIFHASRWQIFRDILFWEAMPQIFVGMRLALSTSLIVVILSEMFIGTRFGLGQRLFDAYAINAAVDLYALLLLVGIVGYALNKIFVYFEGRALFWIGK